MPPGKRFAEMEQLSGGEKTMAALALLFAIHRSVFQYNRQIQSHADRLTAFILRLSLSLTKLMQLWMPRTYRSWQDTYEARPTGMYSS